MAAKALKSCGIDLSGRLYLTASPGEIGPEPIEEARGVQYMGKEIGTHYAFFIGSKSVPDHDWLQAELTYALASQMTLKASMDLPDFYMRRQTDFKIE